MVRVAIDPGTAIVVQPILNILFRHRFFQLPFFQSQLEGIIAGYSRVVRPATSVSSPSIVTVRAARHDRLLPRRALCAGLMWACQMASMSGKAICRSSRHMGTRPWRLPGGRWSRDWTSSASCPFGVVPGRYALPPLCHGNRRRCHFPALLFAGGSSGGTAATDATIHLARIGLSCNPPPLGEIPDYRSRSVGPPVGRTQPLSLGLSKRRAAFSSCTGQRAKP